MAPDKEKLTRTSRYLRGTSAKTGLDGEVVLSALATGRDPRAGHRLRMTASAKHEYDSGGLASLIASAPDSLFFLDSSMFHRSTDHRIWDALLSHLDNVVVVRAVRRECEPWVESNPEHVAAAALRDGHPSLREYSLDALGLVEQATFTYYVKLLSLRSAGLRAVELLLEHREGRPPQESDRQAIDSLAHQLLGQRGYVLAKKAAAKRPGAGFADEVVVYAAVSSALETGRRAMILTKDEDLQEHFYKLLWLLDTHYRGMLLADAYLTDLKRFQRIPWDPALAEAVEEAGAVLLERTEKDLWDILPDEFEPIPVACVVAGERLTWMEFAFETPMRRLLSIKGRTGGLNTERLEPRNSHAWVAPFAAGTAASGCAALALDRRVTLFPSSNVRIPVLDINQALAAAERFTHVVERNA